MVPGLGDDIQAIKAGILEIGDIFVVNKADRDGADRTVRELGTMLEMNPAKDGAWRPRVLRTEAQRNVGIEELVAEADAHRRFLAQSGGLQHLQEEKSALLFMEILRERLFTEVYGHIHLNGQLRAILEGLASRRQDPYSAVELVMAERLVTGTRDGT
jgi:LAO/AO transport system kinase